MPLGRENALIHPAKSADLHLRAYDAIGQVGEGEVAQDRGCREVQQSGGESDSRGVRAVDERFDANVQNEAECHPAANPQHDDLRRGHRLQWPARAALRPYEEKYCKHYQLADANDQDQRSGAARIEILTAKQGAEYQERECHGPDHGRRRPAALESKLQR